MDGDDSFNQPKRRRRVSSTSDDSNTEHNSPVPRRRTRRTIVDNSSDTDSSVDLVARKRTRFRIDSSGSSSSGSEIFVRKRSATRLQSDDESSSSVDPNKRDAANGGGSSSSDSDGQSEKCPICLLSFKSQEVGNPESCDHSFCVECIEEWSKNVNTCPVDRQPFTLILVRNRFEGKVVRQVPVVPGNLLNDVNPISFDDATYCEVCGQCDREERMLLCDGCDLGYHMECLDPPVRDIPAGFWYCQDCDPDNSGELRDAATRYYVNSNSRLIPRTRQSERVRTRILTHRSTNSTRQASGGIEQIEVVVQQNSTSSSASRRNRIRITIDRTNDGGTVRRRKERKRRRRKRRKQALRVRRALDNAKTVKRRLASQLGMVAPRGSGQSLPDVRISSEGSSIGYQRYQAGIPQLHLYGRNDLDYFSDSHLSDEASGSGAVVARRPNRSDVATIRRTINRKALLLSPPTVAAPGNFDLLGSIMASQEQFHSRRSQLTVSNDGSIKVDNNNRLDLNDMNNVRVRKATTGGASAAGSDRSSGGNGGDGNHAAQSQNSISSSRLNSASGSGSGSASGSLGGGIGGFDGTLDDFTSQPCESGGGDTSSKKSDLSDSELDIYSDIETVSTSKVDEQADGTDNVESPITVAPLTLQSDDEANNSDVDLVIDTEKVEEKKDPKEEAVSSTTENEKEKESSEPETSAGYEKDEEDNDSEDGCPNFSIYSTESINLAKTTEMELLSQQKAEVGSSGDVDNTYQPDNESRESAALYTPNYGTSEGPERDAENADTNVTEEEKDQQSSAIINDDALDESDGEIRESPPKKKPSNNLYSDSDEELVSKRPFGLSDIRNMTEDISDEEERSYTPCLDEKGRAGLEDLGTEAISDEEKNDFDESHEFKNASDAGDALEINAKESELDFTKPDDFEEVDKQKQSEADASEKDECEGSKESGSKTPEERTPDVNNDPIAVDKGTPTPPPPEPKETFKKISKNNKDRNYRDKENVREKSRSRSKEKSSKEIEKKKKEKRKEIERYNVRTVVADKPRRLKDKFGRDARRHSSSRSRSRSGSSPRRRRTSRSPRRNKRRPRSVTRSRSPRSPRRRSKKRRSSKRRKEKQRKERSYTPPVVQRRHRDWSPKRSLTPSWTPPRVPDKQPQNNLTVILTNDSSNANAGSKKRKEKRKREAAKRKRDRTPPPSKEVFTSGNNILVSVSFNKENDENTGSSKRRRASDVRKRQRNRKQYDLAGVKPVAIIDLERSPFKEITPSPKDVIILTDSESGEHRQDGACNSSQPAEENFANISSGPKTPPEPQVKFSLNSKPQQIRAITNPLLDEGDDLDMEDTAEIDPQEELEQRLNESLHKGPNTPPEPPNSPPSSPDAYDPFDPTKSRSPTPELSIVQSSAAQSTENLMHETSERPSTPQKSPDIFKSHTPPTMPDVQPADSQSNNNDSDAKAQESSSAQPQPAMITSTPLPSVSSRINILNSTILTSTTPMVPTQRLSLPPIITKQSPMKKAPPIATPVKPKQAKVVKRKISNNNNNNRSNDSVIEVDLDFDSPYSPGPSDYEDLFEPPVEVVKSKPKASSAGNNKSNGIKSSNPLNAFDSLFGSSPHYKPTPKNKLPDNKRRKSKGTKMVGVKIDEDSLKILDDVPNSAVEMQVKDKFLKKLNRQERVIEEVKLVLKPHYNKKHVNKEEYKDIMRRAVPKICHNKSGEINPKKIQGLVEAYVKKVRHSKKVTSSSSVNNPPK